MDVLLDHDEYEYCYMRVVEKLDYLSDIPDVYWSYMDGLCKVT